MPSKFTVHETCNGEHISCNQHVSAAKAFMLLRTFAKEAKEFGITPLGYSRTPGGTEVWEYGTGYDLCVLTRSRS